MTSHAQALARAISSLVTDHDVTDVLATLLADAQQGVDAAAAGLLVRADHGELEVLSTTTHRVVDIEAYQAQQVEGPCAQAITTGSDVFQNGVDAMIARWPGLASYLTEAGYEAVQAHPLRWHGQVLGAINFFYASPVPEDGDLLTVGQAFADVATLILLTPREIAAGDIATLTQEALTARTIIEQAKGVLAYQRNVSIDRAYDLLREVASADHATLSEAAADLVRRASNA